MALDPIYPATAIEAALAAGRIHRRYFRDRPEIQKKGRIDLVTAADLESEQMFRELIARRFPSHEVVGEEGGGLTAERTGRFRWIVDPVDGTTNFAHGLALFCISIALEVDGVVEAGVVFDPIADELFTAERGDGARLNGEPLRTTTCTVLEDAVLCTGFPYSVREDRQRQVDVFAAFLGEARAVRRLGSAALDLAYVAAGRLDAFWEERLFPWDMAAGALIVQEAGGLVSGMDGTAFDLYGGHVIASNGHMHEAMVRVIATARRASTT